MVRLVTNGSISKIEDYIYICANYLGWHTGKENEYEREFSKTGEYENI